MTRILVTRPATQAGELVALLVERGIEAVAVPTVEIGPIESNGDLDAAIQRLEAVDWLVLTSANGASVVLDRLRVLETSVPGHTRVAAVGPATAEVLSAGGIRVDHVPDRYLTAAIADGLGDVAGLRVLLARADLATRDLPEALHARGAQVTEVTAYRTLLAPPASRDPLRRALRDGLDGITFTSASTVRGLRGLLSPVERGLASTVPAFCIGPVTADAARHAGFAVAAVAADHTAVGLADAIAASFAEELS